MTTALQAVRGDTIHLLATVTQNLLPVDLQESGTAVWFTLKARVPDADPGICQKTVGNGITIGGDDNNQAAITIEPADTANVAAPAPYHWDLQVKLPDGSINTAAIGTLLLLADITRAVA